MFRACEKTVTLQRPWSYSGLASLWNSWMMMMMMMMKWHCHFGHVNRSYLLTYFIQAPAQDPYGSSSTSASCSCVSYIPSSGAVVTIVSLAPTTNVPTQLKIIYKTHTLMVDGLEVTGRVVSWWHQDSIRLDAELCQWRQSAGDVRKEFKFAGSRPT